MVLKQRQKEEGDPQRFKIGLLPKFGVVNKKHKGNNQ